MCTGRLHHGVAGQHSHGMQPLFSAEWFCMRCETAQKFGWKHRREGTRRCATHFTFLPAAQPNQNQIPTRSVWWRLLLDILWWLTKAVERNTFRVYMFYLMPNKVDPLFSSANALLGSAICVKCKGKLILFVVSRVNVVRSFSRVWIAKNTAITFMCICSVASFSSKLLPQHHLWRQSVITCLLPRVHVRE